MKTACKICITKGAIVLSGRLVGCASGDDGQVLSGILQGVGQGLSCLWTNNIVKRKIKEIR